MVAILRLVLNKAFKSWTVWAGLLITLITSVDAFLTPLVEALGDISPGAAAQGAALLMLVARLRSIVLPVLKDLVGK